MTTLATVKIVESAKKQRVPKKRSARNPVRRRNVTKSVIAKIDEDRVPVLTEDTAQSEAVLESTAAGTPERDAEILVIEEEVVAEAAEMREIARRRRTTQKGSLLLKGEL